MQDVRGEEPAGVWTLGQMGIAVVSEYLSSTPGCRAAPELGDKCGTSCASQAVAEKMERRLWARGALCGAERWDLRNRI